MLLDFDTLPDKAEDADAVVRFRLKKSLPFDVDQSAVSFDRQGTAASRSAWSLRSHRAAILEEYESAVREAGYNPGHGAALHAGGARAGGRFAADHGHQG